MDPDVYSDQESPLNALLLPPLVVLRGSKPSSSKALILEMTSVNETSPEESGRDWRLTGLAEDLDRSPR